MPFWLETTLAICLVLGSLFTLIGAIGLFRLPDFFSRLHGPTKATTLGVGSTLIGSMIYFTYTQGSLSIHELLITLFLMITAPVSAHILSKAAVQEKVYLCEKTRNRPWTRKESEHTP